MLVSSQYSYSQEMTSENPKLNSIFFVQIKKTRTCNLKLTLSYFHTFNNTNDENDVFKRLIHIYSAVNLQS